MGQPGYSMKYMLEHVRNVESNLICLRLLILHKTFFGKPKTCYWIKTEFLTYIFKPQILNLNKASKHKKNKEIKKNLATELIKMTDTQIKNIKELDSPLQHALSIDILCRACRA